MTIRELRKKLRDTAEAFYARLVRSPRRGFTIVITDGEPAEDGPGSIARIELSMLLLPWVQQHTIIRRDTSGQLPEGSGAQYLRDGLVSDNEAVEELCDAILGP